MGAAWMAETRDGPAILSWSYDQTLRLWDPMTGAVRGRMDVSGAEAIENVGWLAGSSDGPVMVSWSKRGPIHVWHPTTGKMPIQIVHKRLRGARLVENAFGGSAIMSWATSGT